MTSSIAPDVLQELKMSTPRLLYSLDSVCCRQDRVFGWGWLFSPDLVVERVELVLTYSEANDQVFRLPYGNSRSDVGEAFPDVSWAVDCGFLVAIRWESEHIVSNASLHATFHGGATADVDIPGFPIRYANKPDARARWPRRLVKVLRKVGAGSFHSNMGLLLTGARRGREYLQGLAAGLLAKCVRYKIVVFDHSLGGGANRYRNDYIRTLLRQHIMVCLVFPRLSDLTYQMELRTRFGTNRRSFSSESELLSMLASQSIAEIVINNLVSYDDPELIISWAVAQKAAGTSLRVMLHDFFFVCANFTLLDEHHKYCGVPGIEGCQSCLANSDTTFLSLLKHRDQQAWRHNWWSLLTKADEIVAFSQSTLDIGARAYPKLGMCNTVVKPHTVDYLPLHKLSPNFDDPIVIGVVGHISVQKGADIIHEISRLIEIESLDIRIVVVGTLDGQVNARIVKQLGVYKVDELANILETEKVNVGFLPSIIPETFSYVTSELMSLGLPLAVFNLGAPAERVSTYDLGSVIPEVNPRSALETIVALYERLKAKSKVVAC